MRKTIFVICMAFATVGTSVAQVNLRIGIALPGVSLGIIIPSYPNMLRMPNYPVYYAPGSGSRSRSRS